MVIPLESHGKNILFVCIQVVLKLFSYIMKTEYVDHTVWSE